MDGWMLRESVVYLCRRSLSRRPRAIGRCGGAVVAFRSKPSASGPYEIGLATHTCLTKLQREISHMSRRFPKGVILRGISFAESMSIFLLRVLLGHLLAGCGVTEVVGFP